MKHIPWFLPIPLLFLPVALLPGAGTGMFVAMFLTGMASVFVLLQYGKKCSRQERTPEAYWNHVKSGWQSVDCASEKQHPVSRSVYCIHNNGIAVVEPDSAYWHTQPDYRRTLCAYCSSA